MSCLKKVIVEGDYEKASNLQLKIANKMEELRKLYCDYKVNIID